MYGDIVAKDNNKIHLPSINNNAANCASRRASVALVPTGETKHDPKTKVSVRCTKLTTEPLLLLPPAMQSCLRNSPRLSLPVPLSMPITYPSPSIVFPSNTEEERMNSNIRAVSSPFLRRASDPDVQSEYEIELFKWVENKSNAIQRESDLYHSKSPPTMVDLLHMDHYLTEPQPVAYPLRISPFSPEEREMDGYGADLEDSPLIDGSYRTGSQIHTRCQTSAQVRKRGKKLVGGKHHWSEVLASADSSKPLSLPIKEPRFSLNQELIPRFGSPSLNQENGLEPVEQPQEKRPKQYSSVGLGLGPINIDVGSPEVVRPGQAANVGPEMGRKASRQRSATINTGTPYKWPFEFKEAGYAGKDSPDVATDSVPKKPRPLSLDETQLASLTATAATAAAAAVSKARSAKPSPNIVPELENKEQATVGATKPFTITNTEPPCVPVAPNKSLALDQQKKPPRSRLEERKPAGLKLSYIPPSDLWAPLEISVNGAKLEGRDMTAPPVYDPRIEEAKRLQRQEEEARKVEKQKEQENERRLEQEKANRSKPLPAIESQPGSSAVEMEPTVFKPQSSTFFLKAFKSPKSATFSPVALPPKQLAIDRQDTVASQKQTDTPLSPGGESIFRSKRRSFSVKLKAVNFFGNLVGKPKQGGRDASWSHLVQPEITRPVQLPSKVERAPECMISNQRDPPAEPNVATTAAEISGMARVKLTRWALETFEATNGGKTAGEFVRSSPSAVLDTLDVQVLQVQDGRVAGISCADFQAGPEAESPTLGGEVMEVPIHFVPPITQEVAAPVENKSPHLVAIGGLSDSLTEAEKVRETELMKQFLCQRSPLQNHIETLKSLTVPSLNVLPSEMFMSPVRAVELVSKGPTTEEDPHGIKNRRPSLQSIHLKPEGNICLSLASGAVSLASGSTETSRAPILRAATTASKKHPASMPIRSSSLLITNRKRREADASVIDNQGGFDRTSFTQAIMSELAHNRKCAEEESRTHPCDRVEGPGNLSPKNSYLTAPISPADRQIRQQSVRRKRRPRSQCPTPKQAHPLRFVYNDLDSFDKGDKEKSQENLDMDEGDLTADDGDITLLESPVSMPPGTPVFLLTPPMDQDLGSDGSNPFCQVKCADIVHVTSSYEASVLDDKYIVDKSNDNEKPLALVGLGLGPTSDEMVRQESTNSCGSIAMTREVTTSSVDSFNSSPILNRPLPDSVPMDSTMSRTSNMSRDDSSIGLGRANRLRTGFRPELRIFSTPVASVSGLSLESCSSVSLAPTSAPCGLLDLQNPMDNIQIQHHRDMAGSPLLAAGGIESFRSEGVSYLVPALSRAILMCRTPTPYAHEMVPVDSDLGDNVSVVVKSVSVSRCQSLQQQSNKPDAEDDEPQHRLEQARQELFVRNFQQPIIHLERMIGLEDPETDTATLVDVDSDSNSVSTADDTAVGEDESLVVQIPSTTIAVY